MGMPMPPTFNKLEKSNGENTRDGDFTDSTFESETSVSFTIETSLMKRGRRRIVWEAAAGCLGLAVKVWRPIFDNTYIAHYLSKRMFSLRRALNETDTAYLT